MKFNCVTKMYIGTDAPCSTVPNDTRIVPSEPGRFMIAVHSSLNGVCSPPRTTGSNTLPKYDMDGVSRRGKSSIDSPLIRMCCTLPPISTPTTGWSVSGGRRYLQTPAVIGLNCAVHYTSFCFDQCV